MKNSTAPWMLVDTLQPEFLRPDTASFLIHSADELEAALHDFAHRMPRQIVMQNDAGQSVFISIGGRLAGIHCYLSRDASVGFFACPQTPSASGSLFFTGEGQPTEVEPTHLLPVEQAIALVVEFYRTGELSSSVDWEEG